MKKIAILQSNYIPWKGVFDMIHQADVFVFPEDVQYTHRDWRNRNRIMTDKGPQWLTVPVRGKGQFGQKIFETKICNDINWQKKHFHQFLTHYQKAKHFNKYKWILEDIYLSKSWEYLSELNIYCIKLISEVLKINTVFINSLELGCRGSKDDLAICICKKLDGNCYLSGPAAQCYIVPEKFEKENIQLEYMKYEYPEYEQVYQPFCHNVTILDLIFNCGEEAPYYCNLML